MCTVRRVVVAAYVASVSASVQPGSSNRSYQPSVPTCCKRQLSGNSVDPADIVTSQVNHRGFPAHFVVVVADCHVVEQHGLVLRLLQIQLVQAMPIMDVAEDVVF